MSTIGDAAAEYRRERDKRSPLRVVQNVDDGWAPTVDDDDRALPEEPAGFAADFNQRFADEPVADGANANGARRPVVLDVVSAASLSTTTPPPRRWQVPDRVPAANVTLFSGDGATGKSLLALQLCEATVRGGEWIGTMPTPGKAIYVSAEDELDELHRRLAAINPNLTTLEDLLIVPLAWKDAILAAPEGRDGLLKETPLFAALTALVALHRPALLVLDTLADLFGGDEIKKVHARQFIGILRGLALERDVAIVLLSHPSLSGMQTGAGTSGNTAWSNSVRSRLYLERVKNADGSEDDADIRVLTTKKSNRAASGGKIVVRWRDGRFVREDTASQSRSADREAERIFLALLAQFEREGRAVSHTHSSTYAPARFAEHPNASPVGKANLAKAMERLFARGAIRVEEYGPPSKRRQRIVAASGSQPPEGKE